MLLVAIVGQLLLYGDTVLSMVTIWNRSQTYTHGWIIAPISAYLIWLSRGELLRLDPVPSMLGAVVWAGLNLLWLVGHLAGALVVTQYALVAMIPALVWALLGTRVAWSIAFPLAFLLLCVPSGEAMVPALIEFTADFTVKALQLTGIPVYREGTYFSVPSGDWNVVEACSGIRYLIASFTGGCLFAYLYYHSLWKRAVVVLASILIPILANGLRAYMIVMIGHLSDMKLAVGVDHFIYGWVFFGIVMFGLFWVASLWRESDSLETAPSSQGDASGPAPRLAPMLIMALALGFAGMSWRGYASHLDAKAASAPAVQLPDVAAAGSWVKAEIQDYGWEPRYSGFDQSATHAFAHGADMVQLKVLYYRGQSEGRELISSTNVLINSNSEDWRVVDQHTGPDLSAGMSVRETLIKGHGRRQLLVWDWYYVDQRVFTNAFVGKWLLAKDRILGRTGEGAAVFIATPYDGTPDAARAVLRRFVEDMNSGVRASLNQAKER